MDVPTLDSPSKGRPEHPKLNPLLLQTTSLQSEAAAAVARLNNAGNLNIPEDDVQTLKNKLSTMEGRCNDLHFKNEKLKIDLEHEKHKGAQLERQLRFVQDNQLIVKKLREAFINAQCGENFERKLVEIRDKSVQTWSGVLCRACLDTEKLRAELERVRASYAGCIIIKEDELDKLNETLQNLKTFMKIEPNETTEKKKDAEILPNKCEQVPQPKETATRFTRTRSLDRECRYQRKMMKLKSKMNKSSMDMREKVNDICRNTTELICSMAS